MSSYETEKMLAEGADKIAEETSGFFKKAFRDMKEGAKAQHEVDKANFEAVKAESKAKFEENRGCNTLARAKADAKRHWDDARMSSAERAKKMQDARDEQIAAAKARIKP